MKEDILAHDDDHKRWSQPEDIPLAVLVIPIVLGITLISTVIGMVILF